MTTRHTPALEAAPTRSSHGFITVFTAITAAAAIALGVRAWHVTSGPRAAWIYGRSHDCDLIVGRYGHTRSD